MVEPSHNSLEVKCSNSDWNLISFRDLNFCSFRRSCDFEFVCKGGVSTPQGIQRTLRDLTWCSLLCLPLSFLLMRFVTINNIIFQKLWKNTHLWDSCLPYCLSVFLLLSIGIFMAGKLSHSHFIHLAKQSFQASITDKGEQIIRNFLGCWCQIGMLTHNLLDSATPLCCWPVRDRHCWTNLLLRHQPQAQWLWGSQPLR